MKAASHNEFHKSSCATEINNKQAGGTFYFLPIAPMNRHLSFAKNDDPDLNELESPA